jgi:hypothetical protein
VLEGFWLREQWLWTEGQRVSDALKEILES